MKWLGYAVTAAVLVMSTTTMSHAALTFFGDRGSFNAAAPGLPIEGFQNGSSITQGFTGPLNSSTNNAAFQPGNILPGITFVDNPGPGAGQMFIAGPGQSTNPTTAIGQNFPSSDALDIVLSPGVTAIAFDIFQNFGGGSQSGVTQQYPVSIFGISGLLGDTLVSVPSSGSGFFGVISDDEIIRVSLNHPGAFDVIDDVAFGAGVTQEVPAPAPVLLLGLGLVGVALLGRRGRRLR